MPKRDKQKVEGKDEEIQARMEKDERIKGVFNRPEFMVAPNKVRKVQIDDRFKKAITDKEFNLVSRVDKHGRRVNKKDNAMKDYYQIDDGKKYYDEDGKFAWDQSSSSSEEKESSESSSDEDGAGKIMPVPR